MHIHVEEVSQVGEARRAAAEFARSLKFDETDAGRASLIASELATNLCKHARGGELFVQDFTDRDGHGIEFIVTDQGPGMADINRCMQDGYSTAGSAGAGLGAIKRMADFFDVYSGQGQGTVSVARILAKGQRQSCNLQVGALNMCYPGEILSGDAWDVSLTTERVFVADGLGHGVAAAEAANAAKEVFRIHQADDSVSLIRRIHFALAATRGAAVAMAQIDRTERVVRFVGIGNISGVLMDGELRRMVSHNGTAGHKISHIAEFTYPFSGHPLVLLHSDGLSARWDLTQYVGLSVRHPSVVAGVLFRDFRRARDDATIAVVRGL